MQSFNELVRSLEQHPEWRSELRRLVLSDELLELPGLVRDLFESHRRAEARLERIEESLAALAEAQRRAGERLDRVEESLVALAEAQQRTEARVEELVLAQKRTDEKLGELAEAQRRTGERLDRVEESLVALAEAQRRTTDTVGNLKGQMLEHSYREKATSYFGRLIRRPQVVTANDLWDALEITLSSQELDDLLALDLMLRGHPRHVEDPPEVLLAVEVSSIVDSYDVERALRRATLLRKAGYNAVPVVAGEESTRGGESEARRCSVAMLKDGKTFLWEDALSEWCLGK